MKRCVLNLYGVIAALLIGIGVFAAAAPAAKAAPAFGSVSTSLTSPNGNFQHLAGAHPDLTFAFAVPTVSGELSNGEDFEWPAIAVHDVGLKLPPGFVGNPTSVPTCAIENFYDSNNSSVTRCAPSSQVGYADVATSNSNQITAFQVPVYNLPVSPEEPARFGFLFSGVPVYVSSAVRAGDYGIDSGSMNTDQTLPLYDATLHLWGVPAASSHDIERSPFGTNAIPLFNHDFLPTASEAPPKPFLRNPTSCGTAATFTANLDTWEDRGLFAYQPLTAEADGTPFAFERCGDLPFAPTMSVSTTSAAAEAPTGLAVDITVPQSEAPNGRSTSDVRKVVTTLPVGMAVSDSSAQGLGACALDQLGIGSNAAPSCPDSAKIGSVRIKTPLLSEELAGAVYLAKQKENPFGTTLALYLAVKGPGFYLKLPGRVDADPSTGQLTTTFDNTPQLPFEVLHLELDSGPRAPLSNPRKCGTYAVKSEIVPWSGTAPVAAESSFKVSEGCAAAGRFTPGLRAGTADPNAGRYSPFTLRVTRSDGEQNLTQIKATLPEGVLAKLAGVTVCGDAQAATGSCPAASQVGSTVVGAGPGPMPVYVPEAGKAPTAVYLAGPYRGAPYSLVVKVPAQAGPFDLGTVAVRNALRIDPTTTQVTTESDALPQVLEGIPITYRDVRVEIDRPNFTLNPTSCAAKRVTATIGGSEGASASPSVPFAVANCDALALQPKLAVKFSGAPTRRGGHPKLTATLTTGKNEANLKQVQVTLPKTEFLENAHIKTVCTRVQYSADQCPKNSIYGHAKAWTPLLDKPLEGPVYLRSSSHKLPDLVASLDGQIHVDLSGRISSVNARIRNTFETVPDAPVTKFQLTMRGGGKGLLVNNTQLCKASPRANVVFAGQNGKTAEANPLVSVGGCGKGGKKK